MKCRHCESENIIRANYCASCGQEIPEEDRKAAWDATIYGKIEKVEKVTRVVTLNAVTSHPVFRIAVILAILFYGLMLWRANGNTFAVRTSEDYTVAYNKESGNYYIASDLNSFKLDLYVPGKAKSISVDTVSNADSDVIDHVDYTPDDAISLSNMTGRHYIMTADYGGRSDSLIIYIVPEEELS